MSQQPFLIPGEMSNSENYKKYEQTIASDLGKLIRAPLKKTFLAVYTNQYDPTNYRWYHLLGLMPSSYGATEHVGKMRYALFNLSFVLNPINLTSINNLLTFTTVFLPLCIMKYAAVLTILSFLGAKKFYDTEYKTCPMKIAAICLIFVSIILLAIGLIASYVALVSGVATALMRPITSPVLSYQAAKELSPTWAKLCLAYTVLCYAALFIFAAPLITVIAPKASTAIIAFFSQHCASIPILSQIGLAISKLGAFLANHLITPILSTLKIAAASSAIVTPVTGVAAGACFFSAASTIPTTCKTKEFDAETSDHNEEYQQLPNY